jgi:hypothetical protein
MIRAAFIACFFFLALDAQASGFLRLEVQDVTIGAQDWEGRPTLCVLIVKEAQSQETFGLVEDITDCYWARQAKQQKVLCVPDNAFAPLDSTAMLQHLQALDSQLEFFWSTAD